MPPKTLRQILPKDLRAKVEVTVSIREADKTAEATLAALHSLVDGGGAGLEALLREIVVSTLFLAYSNRMNALIESGRTKLVTEKSEGSAQKRAFYLVQLRRAERTLNEITAAGDFSSTDYYNAKQRVSTYTRAYSGKKPEKEAVKRGRRRVIAGVETTEVEADKSFGGEGGFRGRMAAVLATFVNQGLIRPDNRRDAVTLRFGNIPKLDEIPTSAREDVQSEMNVMWRQLEFGTGIAEYAKSAGNSVRLPRLPGTWLSRQKRYSKERIETDPQTGRLRRIRSNDGSWYLGRPNNEVHVLGSRSGDWLRTRTGGAYEGDALLFDAVFAARLTQRLRGRK